MLRNVVIFGTLALIVGLPFALKPKDNLLTGADETLVIVSPHNEAIRYEFSRGFRDWYKTRTGKTARIDWRVPGGTTEISAFLTGEYKAAFEYYWKKTAHMKWDDISQRSFDDGKIKVASESAKDTPAQAARRAFLDSKVSVGIDLFFGGGSFDFIQHANAGRLVDSGFIAAHPQLFGDGPDQIPQKLGGEEFYDAAGAWIGTVVSAFGICYNQEGVNRAIRNHPPAGGAPPSGDVTLTSWSDLSNPAFFGQVALADPNMSGSVAKAFEMMIQQRIYQEKRSRLRAGAAESADDVTLDAQPAVPADISAGWDASMKAILLMGANTRYFADAATKIPIDVGDGDAALGMAIDFYGRFQAENTRDPISGKERMHYFNVPGGTSIGVDSIGMMRGAPHRQLALDFMEYVMSVEGQKLWNFKVGTPGGPTKYALRRLPIRHEMYAPEYTDLRSDPTVFPYEDARHFTYHREWTGSLFGPIRFIVRVMCVDSHDEARDAMEQLIKARFPPEAMAAFQDTSAVNLEQANGRMKEVLNAKDPLATVRLAKDLSEHFREQYRKAGELARLGR